MKKKRVFGASLEKPSKRPGFPRNLSLLVQKLKFCTNILGIFIPVLWVFASCSSSPGRPAEIFTARKMTETQLELANRASDQGNYEKALDLVVQARKLAVSTDRPKLLIRTWLSQGNILFALGRAEEAAAVWKDALLEAESSGEEELASLCRVYTARSELLADGSSADAVKSKVAGEMPFLKDKLNAAFAWTVIGLADKESRRYAEAESSFRKALETHEKELYLELAAYDWYLVASTRSVAGEYKEALDALEAALDFDRRAENSHGLGMNWLAIGDVRKKAGDLPGAAAAWKRSGEIFRSVNLEKEAALAESRLAK